MVNVGLAVLNPWEKVLLGVLAKRFPRNTRVTCREHSAVEVPHQDLALAAIAPISAYLAQILLRPT
eukprot:CAMPEP_0204376772 /NCGR_PEP_ID=MMETSP0469-20131031/50370_1 /ASSEMBLY_ACC=CAM_ASM_000384 /TAXON_ID=2969 /ORGANISM="Oxyrrhis marina" /LENGTH=65 /DNA_ID=CAMNT_0051367707 /DNA_START=136 /DNA_END=329 /DNA_ORIENTATION=+